MDSTHTHHTPLLQKQNESCLSDNVYAGPENTTATAGITNSPFIQSQEKHISGLFPPVQKKENNTGLPEELKEGAEQLSGIDLSDVNVHYNSSEPSKLNSYAYAQGNDIHLGPGQEKHLPHEAWHVVQQKKGMVKPGFQFKSALINEDEALEKEADEMGSKALQRKSKTSSSFLSSLTSKPATSAVTQRKVFVGSEDAPKELKSAPDTLKGKGSGSKDIDTMITDAVDRHFLSSSELEKYVSGSTETIGVVDKDKTWVRLNPKELLVLGEHHDATVLTDIAKAVNTSKFIYEPYNQIPKDYKEAQKVQDKDSARWQKEAGMPSTDTTDHSMEYIMPKLVFPMEFIKGITLQNDFSKYKQTKKGEQYGSGERLAHYLGIAISMARDLSTAKRTELDMVTVYEANKALLDNIQKEAYTGTYLGDLSDIKKTSNQNILYNFCVAVIDFAILDFEEKKKSEKPDQNTTDAVEKIKKDNHTKDKKKSPRSEEANTWREFYMMKNVLRAKAANFLLAGMGDAHRTNMEAALKKISGVKVLSMDHFIIKNQVHNEEINKKASTTKPKADAPAAKEKSLNDKFSYQELQQHLYKKIQKNEVLSEPEYELMEEYRIQNAAIA